MKNVLQYYYNLTPTTIHQINNDYKCQIGGFDYLFKRLELIPDEIIAIDDLNNFLLSMGLKCHQIMKNISENVVTYVDGNSYVLLKIFVENREMTEDDLIIFASHVVEKSKYRVLDRSDWYNLWTKKVDYIEYQASQLGKNHPLIRKSINYYIGLAENAISLISHIQNNNIYLTPEFCSNTLLK